MLYPSGSGHAPGGVCPITVQNSAQAKDTIAKSKLAIPGQSDESKEDVRTSTTAILQKACPPNYRSIAKEKKQHGDGRRLRSHHGGRQRKLLCSHRLDSMTQKDVSSRPNEMRDEIITARSPRMASMPEFKKQTIDR